ncbi:MAG: sensor domain-containing diguanylate cyclase [Leptolyngbyaceae bacterium]|nr:sensor domain-containing diguanylate cyclase [Leptolyngbyaceae bacterium]
MPWKAVLSGLREAIFHAETVDILMRKTVDIIDAAYQVNSILWVDLTDSTHESWRAYGTERSWSRLKSRQEAHQKDGVIFASGDQDAQVDFPVEVSNPSEVPNASEADRPEPDEVVRRFRPTFVPDWLSHQQSNPQPTVLEDGDLIIPIVDPARLTEPIDDMSSDRTDTFEIPTDRPPGNSFQGHPLRFVFQLGRSPHPPRTPSSRLNFPGSSSTAIDHQSSAEWEPEDLIRLQAIGDHLILACDALTFKRRLEQSQRHVSLLSRTSHILNTSVHPDRAIHQILAEMGQRLKSDRIALFDLRHQSATMIADWERPRQTLEPFDIDTLRYVLWVSAIEVFLQGGASYLTLQLTQREEEHILNDDRLYGWLQHTGAGSVVVLPMFIREEFFGAIALLSQRPERRYTLDELQIAQQITDQLSIALTIIQHTCSPAGSQRPVSTQQSLVNQQNLFTDDLTRLPNREALEKELDALSTTSVWAVRAPFSLVLCDIDYFKLVNDNYGHDVGDRILLRIAQRLQHQLRRTTPLYRYGGEEFVIILEQTALKVAADVADRLRQSIRSMPLRTEDEVLTVTASFGVAQLIPDVDHHALDVLKRAEEALFSAKRQGRDRVSTQ